MFDRIADRFAKKQAKQKLDDIGKKGRGKEDVDAERELIEKTDKVETIRSKPEPGRNDPCSCGSGKKHKKCCGAEK